MRELRYTLLSEGVSDQALLPILTWLLREKVRHAIQPAWADLRRLPRPPRGLGERIAMSIYLYPCDLLFVHRDADKVTRAERVAEIMAANKRPSGAAEIPAVCVVPVRMQEAWLLIDETVFRHAAGNPLGRVKLDLPDPKDLEKLPDPKQVLHDLIRQASELHGRHLRKLSVRDGGRRIANLIDDFTVLRRLSAFHALEKELAQTLSEGGW